MTTTKSVGKRDLVITRIFDAPRELVWKAWTKPELVKRWWGPSGFTAPFCKIDFRVDGEFLFCMRSPKGKDYWNTGVYREIVETERIVYTDNFADEKGNVVPASYYGIGSDIPIEMLVTVTFEELGGKTKLTLRHIGLPSTAEAKAEEGWNESLDKLATVLGERDVIMKDSKNATIFTKPSDREIVMTRIFDASREQVWKVVTDPKLIPQWWGPRNHTTTVDKMDVRPGGVWRFISHGPDGSLYAFNGVYREVVRPERLVQTFEFEGMPGHVSVETCTLDEFNGKTRMTVTSRFETVEDRDGALASGMEKGAAETHDRLAELLKKLSENQRTTITT